MPVIRITDPTWGRLKNWAVPLEDTPEDAVRKVLDAAEEHLACRQETVPQDFGNDMRKKKRVNSNKLRKGVKLPEKAYYRPILEALNEHGGSGSVQDLLKTIELKVKSLLTEVDYQRLSSGIDIRWRNTAQWARWKLVQNGFLKADSPSGIWELSNKGAEELTKSEVN